MIPLHCHINTTGHVHVYIMLVVLTVPNVPRSLKATHSSYIILIAAVSGKPSPIPNPTYSLLMMIQHKASMLLVLKRSHCYLLSIKSWQGNEEGRKVTKFWLTFHFYLHSVVNYQLLLSLSACVLGILWSVHPGMSGLQLDMTYEIHNVMHLIFIINQ